MPVRTDRSRIEAYQRCPRSRWLQYEMKVDDGALGGWQPDKPAFALEIGSGFHKGMEYILRYNLLWPGVFDKMPSAKADLIDKGAAIGIKEYVSNILPYFNSQQEVRETVNAAFDEEVVEDDEPFSNYTVN